MVHVTVLMEKSLFKVNFQVNLSSILVTGIGTVLVLLIISLDEMLSIVLKFHFKGVKQPVILASRLMKRMGLGSIWPIKGESYIQLLYQNMIVCQFPDLYIFPCLRRYLFSKIFSYVVELIPF